MDVKVTWGVPPDQKVKAALILHEAFEDKFAKIFGSKERTISLLSEHLCCERTVTALYKNTVVGVAGLHFGGKNFVDAGLWQLLQHLKRGIFRYLFVGWVLESTAQKNEIVVDTLAVAQKMRNKKIGSRLLKFIIDYAHSQHYKQVTLFVIGTNVSAKSFYERMGFREEEVERIIFPWDRILQFKTAFRMSYELDHLTTNSTPSNSTQNKKI